MGRVLITLRHHPLPTWPHNCRDGARPTLRLGAQMLIGGCRAASGHERPAGRLCRHCEGGRAAVPRALRRDAFRLVVVVVRASGRPGARGGRGGRLPARPRLCLRRRISAARSPGPGLLLQDRGEHGMLAGAGARGRSRTPLRDNSAKVPAVPRQVTDPPVQYGMLSPCHFPPLSLAGLALHAGAPLCPESNST